jgi:hypothetical protein
MGQGVVMKRHEFEATAVISESRAKPRQHVADIKAFTGRGRARGANARIDIVTLKAELDQILQEMSDLATASKRVPGYAFYLAIHRRPDPDQKIRYKQHTLRWREVGSARHMSWDELPARFEQQLPDLVQWYRDATALAMRLNTEESITRGALRAAERYMNLAQQFEMPSPLDASAV